MNIFPRPTRTATGRQPPPRPAPATPAQAGEAWVQPWPRLDATVAAIVGLIQRINEDGVSILLIEHNIGLVLNICDHIHVLDSGEVIEVGPPAAIKASEKVRHAYMGTQAEAMGAVL